MVIKWNGIETDNIDFYWFDSINNPNNRNLGYQKLSSSYSTLYSLCLWFFCIVCIARVH